MGFEKHSITFGPFRSSGGQIILGSVARAKTGRRNSCSSSTPLSPERPMSSPRYVAVSFPCFVCPYQGIRQCHNNVRYVWEGGIHVRVIPLSDFHFIAMFAMCGCGRLRANV
jgi:hypothetical protein